MAELGCKVAVLRPRPPSPEMDYVKDVKTYALDASDRATVDSCLLESINDFNPDIVHVIAGLYPVVNRVNKLVRHLPWLLSVHTLPPYEAGIGNFYGNNLAYYIVRNMRFLPNMFVWAASLRRWRYARVICYSTQVFSYLTAYGCKVNKIILVPLGCMSANPDGKYPLSETSPFQSGSFPHILTIASIIPHKGLHDYLHAISGVVDSFPSLSYVIIGGNRDPRYTAFLKKWVLGAGLEKNVSIIINASEGLKFSALKDSDLYVQPSHEEGFCLAFLDAAMTVPRLLGTITGEMPSIAQDDNLCKIVAPRDIQRLQKKTIQLLNTAVCSRLLDTRRARLTARYSWSNHAKEIASLYEAVLSEKTFAKITETQ